MTHISRFLALAFIVTLPGCTAFVRTAPVPHSTAKSVAADRALAYQDKISGHATVVVTRDAGFMGSGCYIGVVISGTLAARLDPEETAEFYVQPGETDMAAVPDPQGRGLCTFGWDPVPEHYVLKAEGLNTFRISLGAYRRPRLVPAVYY